MVDFRDVPTGTVVKRSPHYLREHLIPRGHAARKQLGMVVGRDFFQEEGKVVCYPRIFWEGSVTDSLTHPLNAVPYRRKA